MVLGRGCKAETSSIGPVLVVQSFGVTSQGTVLMRKQRLTLANIDEVKQILEPSYPRALFVGEVSCLRIWQFVLTGVRLNMIDNCLIKV